MRVTLSPTWNLCEGIAEPVFAQRNIVNATTTYAAEQRDELAAFDHSITSSARASSVGGTSRPRALAVLRLTCSSNLVGCCTGRAATLAPLRMRSTYDAARWNRSVGLILYDTKPPLFTNTRRLNIAGKR